MNEIKNRFWKIFGTIFGIILFIFISFAIDGLLRLLIDVPVIGIFARFLLYLRDKAF